MRIDAQLIERWADRHDARADLPVLVRRLIGQPAGATALAIPGGTAVGQPGFDGLVRGANGHAWVPAGDSCWEMGTSSQPRPKAQSDYMKRTGQVAPEARSVMAFVFVTPRIWSGKAAWIEEVSARGEWREVRAYDAVDIEHWLEQDAAASLWFADLLGVSGPGVESPDRFWQRWSEQTNPPISAEAMFAGRDAARADMVKAIEERRGLIGIRADSAEEAAAFACAVVRSAGTEATIVVSAAEGWRFVVANPAIRLVIAGSPEVAACGVPPHGLSLIVPLGITDTAAQTRGLAANAHDVAIELSRPWGHQFVEALAGMGVERSDAERLAHATGRSWPVFRRLQARNPALGRPGWLDREGMEVLSVVCLLGAWSTGRNGDIAAVERVAGRAWEEVERHLLGFSSVDDAPVVCIGPVWKARSPLELLFLAGPRITAAQLDHFFDAAKDILGREDPAFALEAAERWAAGLHGAVRSESDLLIQAVCDALARLAVVGPRVPRLCEFDLPGRVAELVHQLLGNADPARWYSLERVLPELAESAPEVFLRAIETGLRRIDGGPASMLRESGAAVPPLGSCDYAGLLWALERLAWNPVLLPRVTQALAALCAENTPSNWANSPAATLKSLFRPWWPQTTASDEQRLRVMDRLRETSEEVAWRLMLGCIEHRLAAASANSRPHWRDDDAGAPGPDLFFSRYAWEIARRLLADADGRTDRLVELLGEMDSFGPDERNRIIEMVAAHPQADNVEQEKLRSALRDYVGRTARYGRAVDHAGQLDQARRLLEQMEPSDPIASARWLFDEIWIELPPEHDGEELDYRVTRNRVDNLRLAAVKGILGGPGFAGLQELASTAGQPGLVGWAMSRTIEGLDDLVAFVLALPHPMEIGGRDGQLAASLLRSLPAERRRALLDACTQSFVAEVGGAVSTAVLHSLAPNDRTTWEAIDGLPAEVRDEFWRQASPAPFLDELDELDELARRFLDAGRPRSAFATIQFRLAQIDTSLLFEILDRIRKGEESDGPVPDAYRIEEAFECFDNDDKLPARDVAMMQFTFFDALREPHGKGARKLLGEIFSDPALFSELVALAFKPATEDSPESDESMKNAVLTAWSVLRSFRELPGQDGASIDDAEFERFVSEARRLCKETDRAAVADVILGEAFAHSPDGRDGLWPHECVRVALERPDAGDLRRGFATGIFNKRGVWSKSLYEGGTQERELSRHYEGLANALAIEAPHTAEALRHVARSYADDARREDIEARLRIG